MLVKGGNQTLVSASHKVLVVWVSVLSLLVQGRLSSTVAYAQSAQPSVTITRPANGQTNVLRDVFVSADVSVPNGGINPATLTASTVYLYPTSTSVHVSAVLNTSGGGDVIVLRPGSLLNANTTYTFVVTSGLKDIQGVSFIPFSMSFTTGTGTGGGTSSFSFEKVALPAAPAKAYTALTIGPESKLYAGTVTGEIWRFTILSD